MKYEDEPKIIDITDYRSKENESTPIENELYRRHMLKRRETIQRMRNENYTFAIVNLLLITQSIIVIAIIFILSKLY